MTLIKCNECRKEISDKVTTCIHCGNPISYASVETSYWQQHFYCYGRLP